MNIQVDPTGSNLASATLNLNIRPRAVVGYGVKIFLPSPPNYVTRSPGLRSTTPLLISWFASGQRGHRNDRLTQARSINRFQHREARGFAPSPHILLLRDFNPLFSSLQSSCSIFSQRDQSSVTFLNKRHKNRRSVIYGRNFRGRELLLSHRLQH